MFTQGSIRRQSEALLRQRESQRSVERTMAKAHCRIGQIIRTMNIGAKGDNNDEAERNNNSSTRSKVAQIVFLNRSYSLYIQPHVYSLY